MKRTRRTYRILAIFIIAGCCRVVLAGTYPQTNGLKAEITIIPPKIEVEGRFGQFVAAKSNVFVASYGNPSEEGSNKVAAEVFRKREAYLEHAGALLVPAGVNFRVLDLATDGRGIALMGTEEEKPVVYLFGLAQERWILEQRIVPSESIRSISISDGVIVAGAALKALVFELKGSEWFEERLFPPAEAPAVVKNGYGWAAAVQAGRIAVGAVGDARDDPGRIYVYARVDDNWRLEAELRSEDYIYSQFGSAVALEGSTILGSVAANRYNSGMVYVFEHSSGRWNRTGTLYADRPQESFGRSVAISGRNLVAGAPGGGYVYLFRRKGAGFEKLKLYREEIQLDSLGEEVAVDGNSVFFGAPAYDAYAQSAGIAFLFDFEFGLLLESPWARRGDNSFHFGVAEAKAGQSYTIETSAGVGAEWIPLKQMVAGGGTIQVEVDIPAGAVGFFRVGASSAPQ